MDLCWQLIVPFATSFLFQLISVLSWWTMHKTEWGWLPCMYFTCVPLTGQANLQDKLNNLQDKVDTLQDKVDIKAINLENKLDAFQNTTEASNMRNHHKVMELLHNMSCSLDGKTTQSNSYESHMTYSNISEELLENIRKACRTSCNLVMKQISPFSISQLYATR